MAKGGFYLNIKQDPYSEIEQLTCGFHKHPGETKE